MFWMRDENHIHNDFQTKYEITCEMRDYTVDMTQNHISDHKWLFMQQNTFTCHKCLYRSILYINVSR